MAERIVTIDHLGGLGDGIAETPDGRLHVALTAPGDRARVSVIGKDRAELVEVLEPGPARAVPPCGHFGRCGGCALQHLSRPFVADWKRDRVAAALARAGLTVEVGETNSIPAGTRRRATLGSKRLKGRVLLGFAERASHQLVDLGACPLILPALFALLAPLRQVLSTVLQAGEEADIALTATDGGIDVVLIRKRPLTLSDRETLAGFAERQDIARLMWRSSLNKPAEPVSVRRTPVVRMGVQLVPFPPGGFLQPSAEGEAVLLRLVMEALNGVHGQIVDLFCGAGTFALPLSALGPVSAYDGDPEAVAALRAARNPQVKAGRRDLFREPVTARELNGFAAAVIDPPRAGAEAQAKALAASDIAVVAYVSCNPVSFARDAAILTDGGYRLASVTPVDQFAWSPHIELVGVFRR